MQDMGDTTVEAKEIVKRSYEIVRRFVKGETDEEKVLQRCIIAMGDVNVKDIIVFKNDAVNAGIKAVREGANAIVDVKMVAVGINRRLYNGEIFVAVENSDDSEMTRAMSGIYSLKEKIDGSIVAIGNAPSAAIALCDLMKKGVRPKIVIATPVGFVNAAKSKEMIRRFDVPSVTTLGSRGGSTLCVAIFNALISLAYERPDRAL